MRGTRRGRASDDGDVPAGLEDRTPRVCEGEAQKVVPIQSRASRALSWAGSWAMRPQTAMAAVFLLMIGTSAFVIRPRNGGPAASDGALTVSVTEKAGRSRQARLRQRRNSRSLDNKAAAAAHGANMPAPSTSPAGGSFTRPRASALALAGDPSAPAGFVLRRRDVRQGVGSRADDSKALASALAERERGAPDKDGGLAAAAGRGKKQRMRRRKRSRPPSSGVRPHATDRRWRMRGPPPAGAPYQDDYAPGSQAIAPPPATKAPDLQDGFSSRDGRRNAPAFSPRRPGSSTTPHARVTKERRARAAKSVKVSSGRPAAMGRF